MWTRRRRWLAVAVGVLLAAVLFFWWASRPAPLTAEERRFVGWWTSADWYAKGPPSGPWRQTAVEYRTDRTIRYHKQNTRTGEVTYSVRDEKWRVKDGDLVFSFPRPNRDIVTGVPRADFRARHDYIYEAVWDGQDSYISERYKIPGVPPPGRGGWPVVRYVRCDPPADAP